MNRINNLKSYFSANIPNIDQQYQKIKKQPFSFIADFEVLRKTYMLSNKLLNNIVAIYLIIFRHKQRL